MLDLGLSSSGPLRILCLGAHCDDIEIGCGGTILKLLDTYKEALVYWVVFSSDDQRAREARESAEKILESAKSKTVVIQEFRNSFFPFVGGLIKEEFERIKQEFSPELIFTHYRNDLHQDHRTISELTWNTFRNHFILEYEIPKYDGDFGSPNLFVPIDESTCRKKIDTIVGSFQSQVGKHWFSRDLFAAVLRLRGMESNAASGYAEGFYCRKAVLGLKP